MYVKPFARAVKCGWLTHGRKLLRIFTHVSENDLRHNVAEDTHHHWAMAGQRTVAALKAHNYHPGFVCSCATGHGNAKVFNRTLADTPVWIWRGYHGE